MIKLLNTLNKFKALLVLIISICWSILTLLDVTFINEANSNILSAYNSFGQSLNEYPHIAGILSNTAIVGLITIGTKYLLFGRSMKKWINLAKESKHEFTTLIQEHNQKLVSKLLRKYKKAKLMNNANAMIEIREDLKDLGYEIND